jgi:hypothetical protein
MDSEEFSEYSDHWDNKQAQYLAGLQDSGPDEPDLNKIIDADLGEICKHYKRRRPARARRVRAYRLGGGY